MSKTIDVPQHVVLQGSGRGSTEIIVAPGTKLTNESAAEDIPMIRLATNSGLQDLTVNVGNGASVAVMVKSKNPGDWIEDAFIQRTNLINTHQKASLARGETWKYDAFGVLVANSTRGFTLADNEITASAPISMVGANDHANINHNQVKGYPKNNTFFATFALSLTDSIFENNEISDAIRGFINQSGMSRTWLANNVIENIGGVQNGSELMMAENDSSIFRKKVINASTTTVTLDSGVQKKGRGPESYAFILTGRGAGQIRKVSDSVENTVTVDKPWKVIPDNTSEIAVYDNISVNNLFVDNLFKDTRGTMLFMYGSGIENVIAGNEAYNAGEFSSWTWIDTRGPQQFIYNYISDNRTVNSGKMDIGSTVPLRLKPGDDPLFDNGNFFGNIIRRNDILSPSVVPAPNQYYNAWEYDQRREGAMKFTNGFYNIIDGNHIYNTTNGIVLQGGKGNVIYRNKIDGAISGQRLVLVGATETYALPALGENDYPMTVEPLPTAVDLPLVTSPDATPAGTVNLAKGITPASSASIAYGEQVLTDEKFDGYLGTELGGPGWVQVDLGASHDVSKIKLWHYFGDGRVYHDVIVQLSNTEDFSSGVVTVFNNDNDNSSGLGIGIHPDYFESPEGLEIDFKATNVRYIRTWMNGSTANMFNHWVELQAFEALTQQ